ncbi:MAG: Flp pilus assembly protein CpaB [Deltaproteobacteria bacterium]|nr:Flp pilus assembly protein CpaB [Deltaproteobacteria bacterium]
MSYVHKTKGGSFKLEARTAIIIGWIALCALLFVYVLRTPELFGSHTKEVITKEVIITEGPKTEVTAEVLVPKERIAPGKRLKSDMFAIEVRPVNGMETLVVKDFKDIEGAFSSSVIAAKAPLLKDYLTFAPPANEVTERIPHGYRGMTISVNAESGVEGWVRPGVRVDVLWTSNYRGKATVNTIVENVEVLSAERSTDAQAIADSDAPIPSHVTLAVTADDANRIQLAKASGSLSLVLRGAGDEMINPDGSAMSVDKLLRSTRSDTDNNMVGWVSYAGKKFRIDNEGKLWQGATQRVTQ